MNKQNIIADEIDSDYFHYHKVGIYFSQEISSLPKSFNHKSQIWNDSCDAGFIMKSHKTGKEFIFAFDSVDYADKNKEEIAGWNFKVVYENGMDAVQKSMTVLIIND